MVTASFAQFLPVLPSLVVGLLALIAAVVVFTRARLAGLLFGGGTLLNLFMIGVGISVNVWVMGAQENGIPLSEVGRVTMIVGIARSLGSGLGDVLVIAALLVAVFVPARAAADADRASGPGAGG